MQILDGGASILWSHSPHCAQVPENPTGRITEAHRWELVSRRIRADLTFLAGRLPLPPSRIVPCEIKLDVDRALIYTN